MNIYCLFTVYITWKKTWLFGVFVREDKQNYNRKAKKEIKNIVYIIGEYKMSTIAAVLLGQFIGIPVGLGIFLIAVLIDDKKSSKRS